MVWDDAVKSTRHGVLVVHEWWGTRATSGDRLCRFALDLFGKGQVTTHPKEPRRL
jgi:hypothetical protein